MKKIILLVFLLTIAFSAQARRGGNFGLGITLGKPTGFGYKYWLGTQNALSGNVAFGHGAGKGSSKYLWQDPDLYLQTCYLWHNYSAIPLAEGAAMPLYVGVGGRVIVGTPFQVGPRVCGGLSFMPATVPLDFFMEIGVTVDVFSNPDADPDGGIGVRYFF